MVGLSGANAKRLAWASAMSDWGAQRVDGGNEIPSSPIVYRREGNHVALVLRVAFSRWSVERSLAKLKDGAGDGSLPGPRCGACIVIYF